MGATHKILVQKFGGTSLGSAESLNRSCGIIAQAHREHGGVVAVVSARGDTTDDLLRLADSVARQRSLRETDQLLATGEVASAALVAMALQSRGVPARSMTGAQAGITTAGPHGAGVVASIDPSPLLEANSRGETVVVAGFQGAGADGDVVTLGRGGSDTTAIALAAVLGARCEIYTDVEGVYTADPRLVPTARLLPEVPGPVMAELSFAGAKVLHPRAAELAALASVDVQVRSSLSGCPGTRISAMGKQVMEDRGALMAVTSDRAVARVLVRGQSDLTADVFTVLAAHTSPVDLVARSGSHEAEFRMGFTIPRVRLDALLPSLTSVIEAAGGWVESVDDVAKVSLVGTGLLNRPQLVARMYAVLRDAGIATSWMSATQMRTSVVLHQARASEAVWRLHDEFALGRADFKVAAMDEG